MTKNLQKITDEHISFQHAVLHPACTTFVPTSGKWWRLQFYLSFEPYLNAKEAKIYSINKYISQYKIYFELNDNLTLEIRDLSRKYVYDDRRTINSNKTISLACLIIVTKLNGFYISHKVFKEYLLAVGKITNNYVNTTIAEIKILLKIQNVPKNTCKTCEHYKYNRYCKLKGNPRTNNFGCGNHIQRKEEAL